MNKYIDSTIVADVLSSTNKKRKGTKKEDKAFLMSRAYSDELTTGEKEGATLLKSYKDMVVDAYKKNQLLHPSKQKEFEEKILDTENGLLISSISIAFKGDTIDKILNFIPEVLYQQNVKLETQSTGLALKSLQLTFPFDENILENSFSSKALKNMPIILYERNEWAKNIFGENPQNSQKKRLEEHLNKLKEFRVISPSHGGGVDLLPLIFELPEHITKEGKIVRRLLLNSVFTLAIENGTPKERFIKSLSVAERSKYLSNKIEWRLSSLLENYYSASYNNIKNDNLAFKIKVDTIIEKIGTEISKKHRNETRTLKAISSSFHNMEQLGIIKKGSFRREGDFYLWDWDKDYFAEREN